MNTLELIITILTTILSILGVIFGILSKYNKKANLFHQKIIEIEEEIKKICDLSDDNFENCEEKKKYILTKTIKYLNEKNINIEEDKINEIIESIIKIKDNIK